MAELAKLLGQGSPVDKEFFRIGWQFNQKMNHPFEVYVGFIGTDTSVLHRFSREYFKPLMPWHSPLITERWLRPFSAMGSYTEEIKAKDWCYRMRSERFGTMHTDIDEHVFTWDETAPSDSLSS